MNSDQNPVHRDHVDDLAQRAEELIDRRAMLTSATRKLAVPVLITYVCSRNAMGQTGSPTPNPCGPSAHRAP